jgi:hypothetical protein
MYLIYLIYWALSVIPKTAADLSDICLIFDFHFIIFLFANMGLVTCIPVILEPVWHDQWSDWAMDWITRE